MKSDALFLSVVSPVYRAENILDELEKRITEEAGKITDQYEVILVEDGSPDNSWEKIDRICARNPKVKGIKLSRNFGQHYAIAAGIIAAKGEYAIVMDCDLQDNPKYMQELINKAKEGYDVVYTVKERRSHGFIKNILANLFHYVFNWLAGSNLPNSHGKIGTYSLISQKVVKAYQKMNDYYRPYLIMLQWLGFPQTFIQIKHEERFAGKTSYNLRRLISHAINGIISQTDKLLKLSIYTGLFFAGIGFISIIYIIIQSIYSGFKPGWASLMVLVIFTTGLILVSLGIVGAYIGKIFLQTKNRPLYIIQEKRNM